MQSFRIIAPRPVLAPYVRYYWILRDDAVAPVSERTLPVGCIQLVFHKGKRLLSQKKSELQPQSFICGQESGYSDVQSTGHLEMITVVLQPYAAKAFFRIPMYLFYGRNISIDDIEDKEFSELSRQICDTPDNDLCISYIEEFLIRRLIELPEFNLRRVASAIHRINIHPQVGITELADTTCLGNKQFSRIFVDYIGTTPKEFMRIVRLHRALYIMQQGKAISLAQLAYECGFADQSHMIKEFKLFSGYTPTEYFSICAPYSDYFTNL